METIYQEKVNIPVGNVQLRGELVVPPDAEAIIVFSHGSGSSYLSPRNRMVAHYLQEQNFGTLLFDLLTEDEEVIQSNRFNISLLAKRLIGATEWLKKQDIAHNCKIGYFGASSGAAAALEAATYLPSVRAIVSRGGRPDLALPCLNKVKAATLFIVGSRDEEVLQLNRLAFNKLCYNKKLEIVPGATHLFEEPGTLQKVAFLATEWFRKYLTPTKP